MRIRIVMVLAVFVLACKTQPGDTTSSAAAPAAAAVSPLSVVQKLKGKSIPTNATSNATKSKWRHELGATQSGMQDATVIANSEFKTHKKEGEVDPKCPGQFKFGASLVKLDWEQTFPDGSSFKGKAKDPAGWPVCTDGASFLIDVQGEITGGKGKFKNATGDWTAKLIISHTCDEKNNFCETEGSFSAAFEY